MRLMILGDTHGQVDFAHKPLKKAAREGVDAIVQVGDFGFIWRDDNRLAKLRNVNRQFGSTPIYFLDGNHEDHDFLAELGATPDADRFVELEENITYLPRGFAWEWDGVRFMSVGGAVSVDVEPDWNWPGRTLGFDWFEQEIISYRDVDRAISKGPVDVLFSHDVPELPAYLGEKMGRLNYKLDRASRSNRIALATIAEAVTPKLIGHGHYHYRYNDLWQNSVVFGLGKHDHGVSQYVILDTDKLDEQVAEARAQIESRKLW